MRGEHYCVLPLVDRRTISSLVKVPYQRGRLQRTASGCIDEWRRRHWIWKEVKEVMDVAIDGQIAWILGHQTADSPTRRLITVVHSASQAQGSPELAYPAEAASMSEVSGQR